MSAPDDPLADRIDTLGHIIHTGWLMKEMRQMKAIHERLSAEADARDLLDIAMGRKQPEAATAEDEANGP